MVYSKGMSTSLALELTKTQKLRGVVLEQVHSDLTSLNKYIKMKAMKLSKACFSQLRNNFISDNLEIIRKLEFTKYSGDTSVNQESEDKSQSRSLLDYTHLSSILGVGPRVLILEPNSFHQRVMSNDVIWALLSKLHNADRGTPEQRISSVIEDYSKTAGASAELAVDAFYSGCVRHIAFNSATGRDFKRQHRHRFLESLRWLVNY